MFLNNGWIFDTVLFVEFSGRDKSVSMDLLIVEKKLTMTQVDGEQTWSVPVHRGSWSRA